MNIINFETALFKIGSWTILQLPNEASGRLPSRGQTMVIITINDMSFRTPLEPDGKWSHWLRISSSMQKAIHASHGDTVKVSIEPIKEWVEPEVPNDLKYALSKNPRVKQLWGDITPLSRWEWIRWIRSTNNIQTRQKRIAVACSKLNAGERRPCCWNRNLCTEPTVSKNGTLLEPLEVIK